LRRSGTQFRSINALIYVLGTVGVEYASGCLQRVDKGSVVDDSEEYTYISMALQPLWTLANFRFLNVYTFGKTPRTVEQPVARPLPTHRTTQTQSKRTRTHDPSVRTAGNGSCHRLLGHCGRLFGGIYCLYLHDRSE
jgi:hypothetical protein